MSPADESRWSPGEDSDAATADAESPYHERRREMLHCPECGNPDCYSIACDERP